MVLATTRKFVTAAIIMLLTGCATAPGGDQATCSCDMPGAASADGVGATTSLAAAKKAMFDGNAAKIGSMLDEMPNPLTLSGSTGDPGRVAIEDTIRRIGLFDIQSLRYAIAAYDAAHRDNSAANAKLFVLVKFLFIPPDDLAIDSEMAKNFGPWPVPAIADPQNPDKKIANMTWPWSTDDGWQLTGQLNRVESSTFQPLKAFDFYHQYFTVHKLYSEP